MVRGVGSTDRHDTSLMGPEATSRAWLEATRQKRLGPAEDIGHTRLLRCC
jgi:hypothetical protein